MFRKTLLALFATAITALSVHVDTADAAVLQEVDGVLRDVLLAGFGSGLTWGACLMTWV